VRDGLAGLGLERAEELVAPVSHVGVDLVVAVVVAEDGRGVPVDPAAMLSRSTSVTSRSLSAARKYAVAAP